MQDEVRKQRARTEGPYRRLDELDTVVRRLTSHDPTLRMGTLEARVIVLTQQSDSQNRESERRALEWDRKQAEIERKLSELSQRLNERDQVIIELSKNMSDQKRRNEEQESIHVSTHAEFGRWIQKMSDYLRKVDNSRSRDRTRVGDISRDKSSQRGDRVSVDSRESHG